MTKMHDSSNDDNNDDIGQAKQSTRAAVLSIRSGYSLFCVPAASMQGAGCTPYISYHTTRRYEPLSEQAA